MSTTNNHLEALQLKLQEIEFQQNLINLLDSMGFFALIDYAKKAYETQMAVSFAEQLSIGGVIAFINSLAEQKTSNKHNSFQRIFQPTRTVFNPA